MRNGPQLLIVVACSAMIAADKSALIPAGFGDPAAERYLANVIEWPETHGDANVSFACVMQVGAKGKIEDGGCYSQNNWDTQFIQAVYSASKKAVLTPARIGKKGKRARVHFLVEFIKKDGEKAINFYNFAPIQENLDEYGDQHISAQRLISKEHWVKACPQQAEWGVVAKAHVDSEGNGSSVDLEHFKGIVPTGTCLSAITKTVTESLFIPAYIDGVPVPSSYEERFPFLH